CKAELGQDQPQAAVLFAAPDFDHALILETIYQSFPDIQLIGGTSDAEISSCLTFQQDSITLTLFCSDEVEFSAAVGRNLSKDPLTIASQTVQAALAPLTTPAKLCLAVPESLTASGVEVLSGLKKGLPTSVPIVGGTTTDNWEFTGTYQFFGKEVIQDAVPILLMAGTLKVGYGVASGWKPVGRKGVVTKVEGNVVYEIDQQPILEFYKDYLGMVKTDSAEYRLAVSEPDSDAWYMRTSNGHHDPDQGSLTFFADVPAQSEVRVVSADRDNLITATADAMEVALSQYNGEQPAAALFFSCAGRLQILGTRIKEEVKAACSKLNHDIPYSGFYTYGEISPLTATGEAQFHNETFVTLVLGTA
ncbi:MAG: FIST N-terminal domain-containing protein, partial [Cyanobacteria bacterium J06632_22]